MRHLIEAGKLFLPDNHVTCHMKFPTQFTAVGHIVLVDNLGTTILVASHSS